MITVNRSVNKMCSFIKFIPFGGFSFCSLNTGSPLVRSTYSIPPHVFRPSTRHATPLNEINLFGAGNPQISYKPKKNRTAFCDQTTALAKQVAEQPADHCHGSRIEWILNLTTQATVDFLEAAGPVFAQATNSFTICV